MYFKSKVENDKCGCKNKKHHICDYIWSPPTCSCESVKDLASIFDNLVITCDEIIDAEKTKTIPKNIICEIKSFCILLSFLFDIENIK